MESQTAAHSVKPQPCAGLGIIPLVLTSLMMPETGHQGEFIQQWHLPSDFLLSLGSLSVPFSPNRSWSVHPYHPAPGWLGQAHTVAAPHHTTGPRGAAPEGGNDVKCGSHQVHSCKQCNKRAGKSWEANVSAKLMILNPVQCFALPTGPRALGDIFAEICFFLDDYYLQCL